MKKIRTVAMSFYGLAIVVYGIQQLIYGNFRGVQVPAWQFSLPALPIWAYITGLVLVAAGTAIIFQRKTREVSLILGTVFLVLVCFVHVPYMLISEPNKSYHLALWTNTFKELALAGGAFIIAGTYSDNNPIKKNNQAVYTILEKIIPYGIIFFCIPLIAFGIDHFLYGEPLSGIVPSWFPDRLFWMYFTGVGLISSGVGIILDIRRQKIAILLGIMIFLWIAVLHLPRAYANFTGDRGNEFSSVFDAISFTSTALLIAFGSERKLTDDLQ